MDHQKEEILKITGKLDRIFSDLSDLKKQVSFLSDAIINFNNLVHVESSERLKSLSTIEKELHNRINAIMFSILAGAGMFISGIITFVITQRI